MTGDLQKDMLDEYGWCFQKAGDGSLGDIVLDLAQTEYEKELDLLDRKCDAWVNEKLEKKYVD